MSLPLPVIQTAPSEEDAPHIVEVAFKGNRRGYYVTDDEALRVAEYVVVETERGEDLGRVKSVGGVAARKCGGCSASCGSEASPSPTERVLRRAEPGEVQRLMVLRADEERVRRKAREMVAEHGLKMKVTETEWQWDRNKLTLYFTAERRVDFRQLVRDLARTFRTRIELKQIGVRDEAALLGGVGRCGRELCCSTWLREIKPISLQLAKDQNLSLNPAQISGTCGRLMCCLTYEHDSYLAARKRFPREGKVIRTSKGAEKVIGIDIWRDLVTLLDEQRQRRVVDLTELRAETAAVAAREEPEVAAATGDDEAPATPAKRRRRNRRSARKSDAAEPAGE
ncbi:MAG TPA: regulatory iron-sulfur-containing complex subunit RicT [Longimicrobiaceae bacterium]|nr:regulatory iron-sulfur-containing complex subunit RicT [Longimicrobiaceae bacterium]